MKRPLFAILLAVLTGTALLAGCAGLRTVTSEVSSFGEWPADRKPASYAFDRLPSQQADTAGADALEVAARGALAKAGFQPVGAGQMPDVLVQVAARVNRADYGPWADPFWWRGGFGYWHRGPWVDPSWSLNARLDTRRYEREVALLIRDRASSKPLFEARASSEATTRADAQLLAAMYEAALMDFPRLGINPRRVTVTLP